MPPGFFSPFLISFLLNSRLANNNVEMLKEETHVLGGGAGAAGCQQQGQHRAVARLVQGEQTEHQLQAGWLTVAQMRS